MVCGFSKIANANLFNHVLSSRTKENGTVLIFVNQFQAFTVPCSLFPNLNRLR
jgi:hypothetical protein